MLVITSKVLYLSFVIKVVIPQRYFVEGQVIRNDNKKISLIINTCADQTGQVLD